MPSRGARKKAGEYYDSLEVKQAARGRCIEIISSLGGLDAAWLASGNHGPCPKCGGKDRCRAFKDCNETGGMICNQCHNEKNGDILSTIEWICGVPFQESVRFVGRYTGVKPRNGKPANGHLANGHPATDPAERLDFRPWNEDIVWLWTLEKPPATVEAVQAIGGNLATFRHGKHHVIAFPVTGENGKTVGWAIYQTNGKPLPTGWDKEAQRFTEEKGMLLTFGSQPGLIGEVDKLDSCPDATVVLLEGTPDVLAAISIRPADQADKFIFLTNSNGANQRPLDWIVKKLAGRRVVVVRDADKPGEAGAARWAAGLIESASEVKNPKLPYQVIEDHGKDFRDWANDGNGWEDTVAWIEYAKAVIKDDLPAEAFSKTKKRGEEPTLANYEEIYEEVDGNPQKSIEPIALVDIVDELRRLTDNWPRRVGSALFVHDEKYGMRWIDKPAALFSFILRKVGGIKWKDAASMVGKKELFEDLKATTDNYVAVETLPHHPSLAGHYYCCGDIQPGDGTALKGLLRRFNPATEIDRHLLMTAIVTPAWGGPAGARPAFLITSDDGRGVGKSTAAKIIGNIWGGELTFSSQDDATKMRTRLLSEGGLARRVATLDNIKSNRFSWSEWEAMLTASEIGGHRMYIGEATRPNLLVWFITLNGASLSTDIAQRCVIIKLNRPSASDTWEEETLQYVEENREAIIADCIGFFSLRVEKLSKYTRWATWEKDVLQRLPDPAAAQALILERRGSADAEADEADLIQEFFEKQLKILGYSTEKDEIFIPSDIAARWFNFSTNERQKTISACRTLSQFIDEGQLPRVQKNPTKKRGRGFIWVGEDSFSTGAVFLDLADKISQRKKESENDEDSKKTKHEPAPF